MKQKRTEIGLIAEQVVRESGLRFSTDEKTEPAIQDLHRMWQADGLEKKVGKGLG